MLYRSKIIASIFIIWISLFSYSNIDVVVASILILTLGLGHGACDIKLITTRLNTSSLKVKVISIFLYIFTAFVAFLVFYSLPFIGFITFLLISSYHFGEQHLHKKLSASKMKFFHFSLYGMVIFLLMIETNIDMVFEILTPLIGNEISEIPIRVTLFVFIFLTGLFWLVDYKSIKFSIPKELFYLLVIYVLFYNTNLIVSFASYFVIWHSIPSIYDQIEYLYKDVNRKTILLYLRNSGYYWGISLAGLIFIVSYGEIMGDNFYRILYSFVASVTIPHIFLMNNILSESNQ
tara:strand:+ start:3288 stop:4160 length:873 start_codon:yes stop_codon:yes gene_type:complete